MHAGGGKKNRCSSRLPNKRHIPYSWRRTAQQNFGEHNPSNPERNLVLENSEDGRLSPTGSLHSSSSSSSSGCCSSDGDSLPASPKSAASYRCISDAEDFEYAHDDEDDGFLDDPCSKPRLSIVNGQNGLLDIALRTVALMRKNQLLQSRLEALQAETRAFVKSVMNNPENRTLAKSKSLIFSENSEENKIILK